MQISINVDETQFKELMDKSLVALPEEKLQEVVLEGFRTYLTNTNVLKELIMAKDAWGYEIKPTQFLQEIMLRTTKTNKLNDLRDEMIDVVRENFDEIIHKAMAQIVCNGIFNGMERSISSIAQTTCNQIINERKEYGN